MRAPPQTQNETVAFGRFRLIGRFRHDKRGNAAIEFALVFPIYLAMVLSLMSGALFYFTDDGLQNAVESASRKIRTGQAQKSAMTVEAFRKEICDEGSFLNCDKLTVIIQKADDWTQITPESCIQPDETLTQSSGSAEPISDFSGGAGDVVLVTACYAWSYTGGIGDVETSSGAFNGGGTVRNLSYHMRNDSTRKLSGSEIMLQASAAFKTEPYE